MHDEQLSSVLTPLGEGRSCVSVTRDVVVFCYNHCTKVVSMRRSAKDAAGW